MKSVSLLFCIVILFSGCKKSSNDPAVNQSATYYIQSTADGVVYNFNDADNRAVNSSNSATYPSFSFSSSNADKASITLITRGNLSGKPETLPVIGATFWKNRFDQFQDGTAQSINNIGMCTITKIDSKEVEGTFYFDVLNGTQKLSVTKGSFKLKFF